MSEAKARKLASYSLNLCADYYQIHIEDEEFDDDFPDDWGNQLVTNKIAVAPGIVGVGTARNMTVPIQLDLLDRGSEDEFDSWDHVVEASLDVPSGKIAILGCTAYFPDATRISVKPGSYRVRIYSRGLAGLSKDGLEGDDYYHIVIWSQAYSPTSVLKRWSAS
ncbi:hypothetical protein EPA93_13445 [Ktedonosporobacter rubrisoli]|uniref:Uncharacterized protein n=1 Tax=Ktedonosporobacter rubrisoli TaxID=2509675 RepID=A0A4P6JP41_KTERU|nr:hypothetical protein [Ktedonosporobacter rubrisoli]QBD76953.1 hypothetical protein EPA93_13445 [Ktedonosporobacter rubrisoli]